MTSHPPSPQVGTPAREISRPGTPGTPNTPAAHNSPSFDYHEERRLHLQDEIYFSHRLPRLPPPALEPGASGSTKALAPGQAMAYSAQQSAAASADASPSAFHPVAPFSQMRHLTLDEEDADGYERNPSGRQSAAGSAGQDDKYEGLPAGLKPNGQARGPGHLSDADPATDLLQRQEQDLQERLDLEEEKRERLLAEGPAASGSGAPAGGMSASVLPARFLVSTLFTPPATRPSSPTQPSTPLGLDVDVDLEGDLDSPLSPSTPLRGPRGQTGQADEKLANELLMELQIVAFAENGIGSALDSLYASFAKCLDLRDKYIALSNQRLGDNPRDHDGTFSGFYPRSAGDVLGVKPEADVDSCEVKTNDENKLPRWRINPPPPPPHWHWRPPAAQGEMPHLEHRDSGLPDASTSSSGRTAGSSSNADSRKATGRSDMDVFDKADFEIPPKDRRWTFGMNEEGVYEVYAAEVPQAAAASAPVDGPAKSAQRLARVPNLKEYFSDLDFLLNVCSDGPAKSFAFRRLKYLSSKWSLYCLLNEYQELADMKAVPHRDFYNVRKVDTHIHHSASMNQKHLLRFIKSKLKKAPNEIVIHRDGKDLTLAEVFESLNLTAYDLSIDTLDMHAHQEFHRFDRFNDRYNPTGSSRLREIFLKTDNLLKGKYLAELTKELITDLEQSKYQQCEWRLSIYGRNVQEWDTLAKWVVNNKLISHNVRWLIQVPRLYEIFKGGGLISNFEDLVKNVFQPLFEVTADPSSHPELHIFLQRVVGFDSVDDESKPERRLYRKFPTAKMWDTKQSPPYSYWIYYMYANMASLNAWRRERHFNTFVLRPHCGEAGDPDHLSSAFLTSHSISHGILLRKVPALQYLFYLKQIGLAMSPLSNNALFLTYERNPFKDFFRTGLNVSLSTDDPLQFHFTQSHLLEEYSCAAQIYKLTPADMCELARNSVLQSGWEMAVKKHWIGNRWYLPGASGNDIHKTNVPTSRLVYRHQTLLEELTLIRRGTQSPSATPGHIQAANPSQLPLPPIFPSPVVSASGGKHHTTMTENDIGAAAMGPTKAAFSGLANQAGLGAMGGLSGPGVTPGPGALDEKIHRKRTESMGKGMKVPDLSKPEVAKE